MSKPYIFSGMKTLIGKKWVENQAIIVEQDKIKAIISAEMIKHHMPAQVYQMDAEDYLVPGFIDMHIHGAGGFDVMDGSAEALEQISLSLAKEGVTGFLATTMTASDEAITKALEVIPEAVKSVSGAAIIGVHLEGPFISPEKIGAQNSKFVMPPDFELFKKWQKVSGDHIRIVTLAPELENAIPLIRSLRASDVIAAIGHTNATYDQTMEAINAGGNYATHLFNAMRPMLQREPGTVGALLMAHGVTVELIADGVHLHPVIYEIAYKLKNKERLLLVTDAMRAKCMDEGCYDLGGQDVHVKNNKAVLDDGTLAGSVLSMPHAIKNMMKFTGCTLEDAILMASYNPASILKLGSKKGSIDVGKDADLVVMDKNLEVKMTMRGGEVVFDI
ncbi:MAG TPA: N-acetylglucosamine-6-phosphate deacetylase [Gammaproteobacteria bacterium]|nr:N-acetylglucosamine-6-phosphate deacetylase [Gammaproteobacteria bacterium]